MTERLQALAREIARELAAGDRAGAGGGAGASGGATRGAPPEQHATSAAHTPPNHSASHRTISVPSAAELTARANAATGSAGALDAPPGVTFVRQNARMADFIDHTLLKAEATSREIDKLCEEAKEHRFAAVCVNPVWVRRCADRLRGVPVQVATVIGFPLGANTPALKREEARLAVADGATELDMVVALGHLKSGDWSHVAADIAAVVEGAQGRLVKVILESATLTPDEIVRVCTIAREMRADYVKTSTGFHAAGGASVEAVALMRRVVGDAMGVKASGGVRDCESALRMLAAGATRIGTSSGVSMAACRGAGPRPIAELSLPLVGTPSAAADSGKGRANSY